jgi:DNA-binding MarR family transcriptional regulator
MKAAKASDATPPTPVARALRDACESMVYATLRLTRMEASEEGLSIPQVFIMLALAKVGPVPISQLVIWSGNSPATIGGILDVLEGAGRVRREHGVEDRRHVIASLTPKGRRLAQRLESKRAGRWAALERRFQSEDAAATTAVLEAIASEFNAWKKDPAVGDGASSSPETGASRAGRGRRFA